MTEIDDLLQKTSRTFALTIPLLPEPTRTEVGVAYLLFRIIDTFEDASRWAPNRRTAMLERFVEQLDGPPSGAEVLALDCLRRPPVKHAGYLELLSKIPRVLQRFRGLQPAARRHIRRQVSRSADGMRMFVARAARAGRLELVTLDDLQDYCYVVAGIVGEMLTELFVLGRPALVGVAEDLRNKAATFGEGLQLVNILKDAGADEKESRIYLPRAVEIKQVLALAARDLATAADYTELLRAAAPEAGLVAFNVFITKLASANLRILANEGLGAKLSRRDVAQIAAEVNGEIVPSRLMPMGL